MQVDLQQTTTTTEPADPLTELICGILSDEQDALGVCASLIGLAVAIARCAALPDERRSIALAVLAASFRIHADNELN
jgi:hypothetical protein